MSYLGFCTGNNSRCSFTLGRAIKSLSKLPFFLISIGDNASADFIFIISKEYLTKNYAIILISQRLNYFWNFFKSSIITHLTWYTFRLYFLDSHPVEGPIKPPLSVCLSICLSGRLSILQHFGIFLRNRSSAFSDFLHSGK